MCWGGGLRGVCYSSPEHPNIYKQVGSRSKLLGRAGREGPPRTKPSALTPGSSALIRTPGFFQAVFPRGRTEHLPLLLQEQPPSHTKMGANCKKALKQDGLPTCLLALGSSL